MHEVNWYVLQSLFQVVNTFDKAGLYKPRFVPHVRIPLVITAIFGKSAYISEKVVSGIHFMKKS